MTDPLPDVHEGLLDPATLTALLTDLSGHATLLEVRVKGAPNQHASAARADVSAIPELLASGARGVQIRYRFDGAEWCDTLMPAPGGVRLVRMKLSSET